MKASKCDAIQILACTRLSREFISGLALAEYAGMMGPAGGRAAGGSRIDDSQKLRTLCSVFRCTVQASWVESAAGMGEREKSRDVEIGL